MTRDCSIIIQIVRIGGNIAHCYTMGIVCFFLSLEKYISFKPIVQRVKYSINIFLKTFIIGVAELVLVSLANNTGMALLFIILCKLFIYIRKSKGPRMEPCAVPCLALTELAREGLFIFLYKLILSDICHDVYNVLLIPVIP